MYCEQFSIYYWEPILGVQEWCLSLGDNQIICNVAACLKRANCSKSATPLKANNANEGFFWLAFGLGSEKQDLSLNEYTRIFHFTRILKINNFCLNFTYLLLYSKSNLTFICRQSFMLFYRSQEAQSVNSSHELCNTISEERSAGKLTPELHFSTLQTYLKCKALFK